MLYYGKRTADLSDFLLFHVNLDPHNTQSFAFEVPLWEFGLPDTARSRSATCSGGNQLHLARQGPDASSSSPTTRPYAIWQLIAPGAAALMEQTVTTASRRARAKAAARGTAAAAPGRDQPDWYKDAIIYQLHVKAFQDTTGDGIGDFAGLMQRLDYVQELGRHRDLADAVLPLAAARRRLRHLRLPLDQPVLRHA